MTHTKEDEEYDMNYCHTYNEEFENPYDLNEFEEEYYDKIGGDGYCENCGSPLKKYYELTEFWGNKQYTPVYYCPICDG